MDAPTGSVNLLVEGAASMFVPWLCLGIALAAACGLLLPWPPGLGGAVMAVVVTAMFATAAWQLGGRREVSVDLAAGTVVERTATLGIVREQRSKLGAEARVEVSPTPVRTARNDHSRAHRTSADYDTTMRFTVWLQGEGGRVRLGSHADVVEAETRASEIATSIRTPALRVGYVVERDSRAGDGPPSVDTRTIVRTVADARSVIAALR